MPPWDAVVIGLGGVGSFALRALSRKTSNILGMEQFLHLHERGSSHGLSRIYRRAYFEHPMYVPWIEYSLEEFRKLEESQNVDIMQECGTLVMEEEADKNVIERCNDAALQHGIPVEKLSTSELKERYPQFQITQQTVGLLEPGGGFLRPEIAMSAALSEAESRGATIWQQTRIKQVREVLDEGGTPLVEVVIERNGEEQVVTSKSVVISAGSWTAALVPTWATTLNVTRQVQGWIDVSTAPDPSLYDPSNMPTWYMCTPKNPLPLYGIPADRKSIYPTRIKMGIHLRNVTVNPDDAQPNLTDDEWSDLRDAGRHSLCYSDTMSWPSAKPCLYTMTPDQHFIVGQPVGTKRIYAVAGLSGHGFKMTPALGQMMADWALQQETSHWNAEFVAPSRFGI